MDKRLNQYRKILKKDRMLFDISEKLYTYGNEDTGPQTVTAIYVMAPIMLRFVLWVLQEAALTGKKRLYFLARDGYSMYRIAKVICERTGLPIECRYLYCSRYAWRNAEYALLKEKSLFFICLGGIDVTFEKVMCRAGLSVTEAQEIAGLLGFSEKYRERLSHGEVRSLIPMLGACKPFMDLLVSHAEEKYPLVCGYLEQEGLTEDIPYAVVDSGWMGSMQKTLKHILTGMGFEGKVEGYYFGMYEYPAGTEHNDYHSWYFKPEEEIRRKVYFSNSLFECIFSSPEGMTLGYENRDERFYPVLEHRYSLNREKVEKTTALLERYARIFVLEFQDRIWDKTADFQETAAKLLYYFMGRPTESEALEFGGYVFCDDVVGEERQTVAAPLSYEEVRENHLVYKSVNMLLKKGKPIRESAWLEGSTVLLPHAGKSDLWQCALYKYLLYLRKLTK